MASGYTTISASVRVDLDAVFFPRVSGPIPNTGYKSAGVDLSLLYEPSHGGDNNPFNVEYKCSQFGGADLSELFKGYITPTPTPTPSITPTTSITPTITQTVSLTPPSTPPPTPPPTPPSTPPPTPPWTN